MTLHQIMVLGAGLTFIAAGVVLSQVFRLLGPTYYTRVTAHWGVRAFFFVGSLILVGRGLILIFPGRAVPVALMSPWVLLSAVVALGMALVLLEWAMRDRAPPPWTARLLGLALKGGASPAAATEVALALPAEPHGPAASERQPCRCVRLCMIWGAILAIATVVAIILNSAAG